MSVKVHGTGTNHLMRRPIYMRARHDIDPGSSAELRKIIEKNASLRVDFGWSFESQCQLEIVMCQCLGELAPQFSVGMPQIVSDTRCSWIGFLSYNIFERTIFDQLSVSELILFNNEMIHFQGEVIRFVTSHKLFKQHAILRHDDYRYDYFKARRKDPDSLADAYYFYIDAVRDVCGLDAVPLHILEQDIGCHFLKDPELFYELLNFSTLKGTVHER